VVPITFNRRSAMEIDSRMNPWFESDGGHHGVASPTRSAIGRRRTIDVPAFQRRPFAKVEF
jgi:hypothetical protein